MLITSRMTSKGQTTIPKEIRDFLKAGPGDTLVYQVEGDKVLVQKAAPFNLPWHATISDTLAEEWNSPEDDEAFRDL